MASFFCLSYEPVTSHSILSSHSNQHCNHHSFFSHSISSSHSKGISNSSKMHDNGDDFDEDGKDSTTGKSGKFSDCGWVISSLM